AITSGLWRRCPVTHFDDDPDPGEPELDPLAGLELDAPGEPDPAEEDAPDPDALPEPLPLGGAFASRPDTLGAILSSSSSVGRSPSTVQRARKCVSRVACSSGVAALAKKRMVPSAMMT